MKKLEDIPKNNVFEVPEGYFDQLPGIIQARVAKAEREPSWIPTFRLGLQYALPVLAIGVASIFYLNSQVTPSAEELLATVDSANLVAYLQDTELSADDLLDGASLDQNEANAIQQNSMSDMEVDAQDLQDLNDEFGNIYF